MKAFNVSSLPNARRLLIALAAVLAVAASTQQASAMPNFPGDIQAHLGLSYAPPCTLCHATPAGGGPVVTLFGQSMLAAGLTPDTAALIRALDTLAANHTDSNNDGRSDIDQLKEGSDPNTSADFSAIPEQKFGCGARIAPGAVHAHSAIALAALVLGLVLVKRRPSRAGRATSNP